MEYNQAANNLQQLAMKLLHNLQETSQQTNENQTSSDWNSSCSPPSSEPPSSNLQIAEDSFNGEVESKILKQSKRNKKGDIENASQKRCRITFSEYQLKELDKVFCENPFIDKSAMDELSAKLNLQLRQVQVWFQNRRSKVRKNNPLKFVKPNKETKISTKPDSTTDTNEETSKDLSHSIESSSESSSRITTPEIQDESIPVLSLPEVQVIKHDIPIVHCPFRIKTTQNPNYPINLDNSKNKSPSKKCVKLVRVETHDHDPDKEPVESENEYTCITLRMPNRNNNPNEEQNESENSNKIKLKMENHDADLSTYPSVDPTELPSWEMILKQQAELRAVIMQNQFLLNSLGQPFIQQAGNILSTNEFNIQNQNYYQFNNFN